MHLREDKAHLGWGLGSFEPPPPNGVQSQPPGKGDKFWGYFSRNWVKIIVNCPPWLVNILKWPSCETAKNHLKLNLPNIVGENIEIIYLK